MRSTVAFKNDPGSTTVITPEREAFLEERGTGIGGSDAGVILGLSKYKTPLDLAEEKLGRVPHFQGNRFTEAGNRLEDVIAHWYADETGSKVARANQTFRLKDHPFIMAHIDRRVLNERKVLECKSADKWTIADWGEAGTDQVPDIYFIQVQHYLMFPNWDAADLAALIGGNDFRIFPIAPDDELQDMILDAEIKFWNTISRGDLPDPINGSDAYKTWPRDNSQAIYADYEVMEWNEELKRSIVSQKELEKKIDDLKTRIKCFMKDYTELRDPDGKKIHTWKDQVTSGFQSSRLRESYPDVYRECTVPKFDRDLLKRTYPDIYKQFQTRTRVFR